jgi:hypothetical protein
LGRAVAGTLTRGGETRRIGAPVGLMGVRIALGRGIERCPPICHGCNVGELGWVAATVLGALLATSWGAGIRRARGNASSRVVRLDDPPPPPQVEGIELSTSHEGSSTVLTLVGRMDRPDTPTLASHLAELVSSGLERVVVDVEKAHPAGRVVEALSLASPILERHRARLALVPPKGELLSVSVKLTANGLEGRVGVYDSVAEATKAVGHTHARP